jgi:hypothetical protein
VLGYDPYDPTTWDATVTALGVLNVSPVYVYPPWTLLALLPLGFLSYDGARIVWTLGGGLLGAAAFAFLLRLRTPLPDWVPIASGLALTLSGAAITNVFTAQWGFLLLAALAVAVVGAYRDARWGALGVVVLLLKPQLAIFAIPGLLLFALGRGSRRFVLVSLASAVLLVGASAALFFRGVVTWVSIIPNFIATDDVTSPAAIVDLGTSPVISATAVYGLKGLVGVGLCLLVRRASTEWLPVWLSASIAFAPHARSYDQLPLMVPLVLASRWEPLSAVAFVVFAVGSMGLYIIALVFEQENWSLAMPLACVALLSATALRSPRRPRSPLSTR